MYTRQQASQIRKKFWTRFGQYMRPLPGAASEPVNWLNYKTGVRHVYFRMDADTKEASISIELKHPDPTEQALYFERFSGLRNMLEQSVGEKWEWHLHQTDEDGSTISRISTTLKGVNIFNEADWPAIISFLKPRIMALDEFWETVRHLFE